MSEEKIIKSRTGTVVSNKMEKSITVSIERIKQHPMYGKYINRSRKIMAHDEKNEANEGDLVRIVETKPISKKKRWKLAEIVERAK